MEEIVKIGKRGQITIPTEMRKEWHLENGDFLDLTFVRDVMIVKKLEKKPSALDLFAEVGEALRKEGITTRKKAFEFAEQMKKEAVNEISSRH